MDWLRILALFVSTVTLALLAFPGVGAQSGTSSPLFRVTSVLESHYLFETNTSRDGSSNDSQPTYGGFIVDLLNKISEKMQFRYEISVRQDGLYGHKVMANGSWTGMIGQLIRKEADIAVGPLTETAARLQVVDFSKPFQTFDRVAIIKRFPKKAQVGLGLGVRLGRLLTPLEDSVWLLSGMAWFVSSLVLYLICRINPYDWRRMVKGREATLREGESFNCINAYWFMIGALFWQGFMRSPRSMGGRIVVAFWWLYALIFVSMYIASLTNYIRSGPAPIATEHYTKIQSLRDIADDSNIKVGAIQKGATVAFLKDSLSVTYSKLWSRMERDQTFQKTTVDGIEKVRQSTRKNPYVFLAESAMAEYHIKQPPCDLYIIRDLPTTGTYSFAFPLNSPLIVRVDMTLLELKESGYLRSLQKKWFSGECKVDVMDAASEDNTVRLPPFKRVDLASFSGALILLLIGLAIGSIVTLFEVFVYKYAEKDSHERDKDRRLMQNQNNLDTSEPDRSPGVKQPMTDV